VPVFEDARGPNVRELRQDQRRLSPPELEALIADYEAGSRVGELAKVYGLHRTTVAGHVARAGKTRPVMTGAQIDEAVLPYRDGWPLHNLGQHLGVADQTIRRVLVERAVTIRPGGRRKVTRPSGRSASRSTPLPRHKLKPVSTTRPPTPAA
jgi:hypothetical protein